MSNCISPEACVHMCVCVCMCVHMCACVCVWISAAPVMGPMAFFNGLISSASSAPRKTPVHFPGILCYAVGSMRKTCLVSAIPLPCTTKFRWQPSVTGGGGGSTFILYASGNVFEHLTTLHCLRLHLVLTVVGVSHIRHGRVPKEVSICAALTLQMGVVLLAKNLGCWAKLMQERHTYLPYSTHKGLREVRRLGFVHAWRVSVTPPHYLIYAIYHLNLGIMYTGLTHMAPMQRLRKHMTDALAGTDGASLHRIILTVEMAGWGIAVLEHVDTMWWAGIREHAPWFELRKWVVNDVAPRFPQEGKPRANHWHHQKVLRLLKEIKQAEYN